MIQVHIPHTLNFFFFLHLIDKIVFTIMWREKDTNSELLEIGFGPIDLKSGGADLKKNFKKRGHILNSSATVMALFNTIMCGQKSFVAPQQERSTAADLEKKKI